MLVDEMPQTTSISFASEHEIPEELEAEIPSTFEEKVVSHCFGAGLQRIMIYTIDKDSTDRNFVEELRFSDVETHEDTPGIEPDVLARLLYTFVAEHNADKGHELKYAFRFYRKRKGAKPTERWAYLRLNMSGDEDDDSNRRTKPPHSSPRAIDGKIRLIDPEDLADYTIGQTLNYMFAAVATEHQNDKAFLRALLEDMRIEKNITQKTLFNVVMGTQKNQMQVNQQGWDALHEGIRMKRELTGVQYEQQRKIDILETENEYFRKQESGTQTSSLLSQLLPVGLIGAGKALNKKGNSFGPFLENLGLQAAGVQVQEPQTQATATQTNNDSDENIEYISPEQGQKLPIAEVIDDDLIETQPLAALSQYLGRTLSRPQFRNLVELLSKDETRHLITAFKAVTDEAAQQNFVAFYVGVGTRGASEAVTERLREILVPRQQVVLAELSARVQGEKEGPLDLNALEAQISNDGTPSQPKTESKAPCPLCGKPTDSSTKDGEPHSSCSEIQELKAQIEELKKPKTRRRSRTKKETETK